MTTPEHESPPSAAESDFASRARNLLLESVDAVDGQTRSRLTQARYAALSQIEAPEARGAAALGRWLVPAGGVAAVALVAVVWFGGGGTDPGSLRAASSPMDDIELMAGAESFELIEDLDFYVWLDSEAVLTLPATGETG